MHHALRYRPRLSVLALLLVLMTGLPACGTGQSLATRTTAAPPLPPTTPTTPTTAATTMPVITPASSAGWATYRDPRFAFQVPLPPGWQPASLTWPPQPDKTGYNYYIVQFFPPGPHGEPGPGASAKAPELIEISITLSGPSTVSLAQLPGSSPEPGTVAFGTTQVQLYDSGNPGYGSEIGREAETTLGAYPMFLGIHYLAMGAWNPAIAQRDIALFLAMLKGYRPA